MSQKTPDNQFPSPDTQDLPEILDTVEEVSPERNAFDRLIVRGGRAVSWLVLVAMGISVVEVFMRYGFNNPTSWVHETVVFLIAVIFVLGGPAAMARNSHIRVKVLYDNVSPRLKCWMDRFNDLLTLIFCLAMSYAAFYMFWGATHNPLGEWSLERSGTSWNPPFPAMTKGMILFALMLMTLQALLHLWQSLKAKPDASSQEAR